MTVQKKTSQINMKAPASNWNEALPVGNGRLGAMVFGGVCTEYLQLNEDSVWYGGPRDRINPSAQSKLKIIRDAIEQGDIKYAQDMCSLALSGIPDCQRHYEALGNLYIHMKGDDSYEEYSRTLDFEEAVVSVSYMHDGIRYERRIVSSYVDGIIAILIKSNNKGAISFHTQLARGNTTWDLSPYDNQVLRHPGYNDYIDNCANIDGDITLMDAVCGGRDGISLSCGIRVISDGGIKEQIGNSMAVDGADSVLILLAADTSFYNENPSESVIKKLQSYKGGVNELWDGIYSRHVSDYKALYEETAIELNDNQWEIERFFNFGRYLMIASSRVGSLPANLQGIWNDNYNPIWGSKYTININTQMNYWPAESCGLSECHKPLFELISRMREPGRKVAREMYGCRGFMAHHNTDIWADCAPQDTCLSSSYWVMGAAWLCLHLWEHYRYTADAEFLANHFETMLEASLFLTDYVIEDGDYLVTSPTLSPENEYILPNGNRGVICKGASMDNQIMTELFEACEAAYEILGGSYDSKELFGLYGITNQEIMDRIRYTKSKLSPIKLNSYGGIREWNEDYEEVDPGHRHISHLFALYPGNQITEETPELMEGARKTLSRRLANGGGHTGWSRAWIVNMYTRLGDGDEALKHINLLLEKSTLPNLFDNHPPFQIDGNFGCVSGIAQMLVQSIDEEIKILPALPKEWKHGKVRGIHIYGGKKVSFEWEDGRLLKDTVKIEEA